MNSHPNPPINRDVAFLYDGFRSAELLVQKCTVCEKLRFPPSPFCPQCHSTDWEAIAASGEGTLHSYTVHYHPPIPPWPLPHSIGLADMKEGFRFVAAVPGIAPDALRIGQSVHVAFSEVDPGYFLPHFCVVDEE
jgi:uncharacterized OB-fold protein